MRSEETTSTVEVSRPNPIIELLAKRLVKTATEKAQKPIQQLRENLPSNPEEIRKLPFYDATLQTLQWQRDNYLVGTDYADQRKLERPLRISPIPRMPYDATALGSIQIVNLGSWFIPSPTVKDALLPIVVSLPSGALKEPITNAVANAVPLAQPQLDRVVKNSLKAFMQNPHWRQVIKNRTKGYIGRRDSN
jgi:hypothetical protein